MDINIQVRKAHIVLLAVLIVGATATATVEIKDRTKIFQELDMTNNPIQDLQNPDDPQDAATKDYVDDQDAATKDYVDTKAGGLNWPAMYSVFDRNTDDTVFISQTASVSCNDPGDILVTAVCSRRFEETGDSTAWEVRQCDTRGPSGATHTSDYGVSVKGLCVPGGPERKTDTVTIDASGESGLVETHSLGKGYDTVVSAEWTGPGIQPTEDINGGPYAEGFGDDGAPWSIELRDSGSGSTYTIATESYTQDTAHWSFEGAPADTVGKPASSPNPVYRRYSNDNTDLNLRSSNYVGDFAGVSADSVRLQTTNNNEPDTVQNPDWTGTEQIKITYFAN